MEKSTKRVNSYLKMVLWMAGGGALGAIIGGGSVFLSGGIHGVFQNLTDWLKGNTIVILGILLVISLILSIFCYTKIEGIVRMSKENEDDEIQDKFDQTFDFWGEYWTCRNICYHLFIYGGLCISDVPEYEECERTFDFLWNFPFYCNCLWVLSGRGDQADPQEGTVKTRRCG